MIINLGCLTNFKLFYHQIIMDFLCMIQNQFHLLFNFLKLLFFVIIIFRFKNLTQSIFHKCSSFSYNLYHFLHFLYLFQTFIQKSLLRINSFYFLNFIIVDLYLFTSFLINIFYFHMLKICLIILESILFHIHYFKSFFLLFIFSY